MGNTPSGPEDRALKGNITADSTFRYFDENGDGIEQDKQAEVIRAMYERKTVIPLFKGSVNSSNFEALEGSYSMCDIITEFSSGNTESQVMEVVEHILHSVTMVGLHYAYYDEWGVSKQSEQY